MKCFIQVQHAKRLKIEALLLLELAGGARPGRPCMLGWPAGCCSRPAAPMVAVVLALVPVAALLVGIIGAAAAVASDTDYSSASTAALIGQRQQQQQQESEGVLLLLQQQWPPPAPATASLASSSSNKPINTAINASTAPWYPFDGVGGLSGGGGNVHVLDGVQSRIPVGDHGLDVQARLCIFLEHLKD
eukprot:COSAG01_NODE_2085_length_8459_cov_14.269139_5_plen_189_part_00